MIVSLIFYYFFVYNPKKTHKFRRLQKHFLKDHFYFYLLSISNNSFEIDVILIFLISKFQQFFITFLHLTYYWLFNFFSHKSKWLIVRILTNQNFKQNKFLKFIIFFIPESFNTNIYYQFFTSNNPCELHNTHTNKFKGLFCIFKRCIVKKYISLIHIKG